ncbi:MAG: 4-hydroxy-tetrahydrodipicolinate synthase [Armatimonadetes bacterium]|nr:4-hydroxy-tetrahydrodipicolinate synthase [Armatimonadota bacterium]MDE2206010.1 4-hydroxy-tetrahydrodipicolinate synthase [Armatimonadota bacterium]
MVTPFASDGAIDWPGVDTLVTHLLTSGSHGLVVCGTTGESPALSHSEKVAMFRRVAGCAKGKPVIAGTGTNNTAESIELSREAVDAGVDGLLLVVPPYNKPSQAGMYSHFAAIAQSVPHTPCILYNVPSRTAQNLTADTTLRLARDVPNIVAIKEASGNLMQISEIAAGAPTAFAIYSGDDGMTLPILSIGGVGVVSVTAHLAGVETAEMVQAWFERDAARATRIHHSLLPLVQACFQPSTPSPVPLKAGLRMMGLPGGGVRPPLVQATPDEAAVMAAALTARGSAMARESAVL